MIARSVVLFCTVTLGLSSAETLPLAEKVDLLPTNGFRQFEPLPKERAPHWSITREQHLYLSGKDYDLLRSRAAYREFHLVLEFQWREHTWGERSEFARLSGITLGDNLEVILREGLIGPVEIGPVKPNKDDFLHRNLRVANRKGARDPNGLENPVGEWNRCEVIAGKSSLRILLNGQSIHELKQTATGQVALRSAGAALLVRRFELWPLGEFREAWKEEQRSTNTGYSETGESILPRREPWSPEKSQAAWKVDGEFELQLVASEPLVCDPVDVVWDEQGRMLVAEMRDYPFPPEHGPRLARIRLLEDRDQDGTMDIALTWADELPDVQGMLWTEGGLLVTSSTGLIFLRDTNGDNHADQRSPLFLTNKARHSQLQLASPRWLLDNTIHLNNGIDGNEIHPAQQPDTKLSYKGFNLRYDPFTKSLARTSGVGQFGATTDEFGRIFFCSNRNPAILEVLPRSLSDRNPSAGFTATHENIQPPASRVFPHSLSHTTSVAHAGTHTSACGLAVYRGDWIPALGGNLFVCDPTAQLVTRNRLVEKGASLEAQRIGEGRDFLVSSDEWCRPVNLRNGPDGALYICDMYRRFIDHAIYFPDEFTKTNYMRAGFDHGRIWRLAPKDTKARKCLPFPNHPAGLIRELSSPISWRRLNAQRLLVTNHQTAPIKKITEILRSDSELARLHAFCTLLGIHKRNGTELPDDVLDLALNDSSPGVVENALLLTGNRTSRANAHPALLKHRSPRVRMLAAALHGKEANLSDLTSLVTVDGNDPWLRRAVMSISPDTSARILTHLFLTAGKIPSEVVIDFSQAASAHGDPVSLAALLEAAATRPSSDVASLTLGLSRGLPRGPLKSLAALLANPPASLADKLAPIRAVVTNAQAIVRDPRQPTTERLTALALVPDDLLALAADLIKADHPPELQIAACRSLSRLNRQLVTDFFFARWDSLAPAVRREAITLITSNMATTIQLMEKMKAGEVSRALMPPMRRWVLSRSADPKVVALVSELFGQPAQDRAKIIEKYRPALKAGDAKRGQAVFTRAGCIGCHAPGEGAIRVGPDIRDVRIKPPQALLSDILDPNRVAEERWTLYQVELKDGTTTAGIITSEGANEIELRTAAGQTQFIPRTKIATFSSTGRSLMPEGLEAAMTPPELADLITFLRSPLNK